MNRRQKQPFGKNTQKVVFFDFTEYVRIDRYAFFVRIPLELYVKSNVESLLVKTRLSS